MNISKDPFHAPECGCPHCVEALQRFEAREPLVQEVIQSMRILETSTLTPEGFALARAGVLDAADKLAEWKP